MYLARLKGFEPLAHGLEGRCSIRLSYRRKPQDGFHKGFAGAQRKQVPLPLTVIDYSIIPERCQQVFGPTGTVLLGSLSHCSKTWFQKNQSQRTLHRSLLPSATILLTNTIQKVTIPPGCEVNRRSRAERYEESPGTAGQGCRLTAGGGDSRESATEINRR